MTDEHQCIVCPVLHPTDKPRIYDRANVCESCRARIVTDLDRIPNLTALLPNAFPKTSRPQSNGSKIRSTPQSSEPINWSPWDLALPADQRKRELMVRAALGYDTDQIGDLSVATELETWALDWHITLFPTESLPDANVWALCRWLSDRSDTACNEHPAIDEFAGSIAALARTVAAVGRVDHSKGEKIGKCPAVLRDETRCAALLRVDPYVDQIQCGRCGSRWDRRKGEWMQLRAAQLDAMKENAA